MSGLDALSQLMLGSLDTQQGWQENLDALGAATGAPLIRTVPGETWERLIAVHATVTASAAVATRYPLFEILTPGGDPLYRVPLDLDGLAAGTSFDYFIGPGRYIALTHNLTGFTCQVMPDLLLKSGYAWGVDAVALQAGDVITIKTAIVQRFPTSVTQP